MLQVEVASLSLSCAGESVGPNLEEVPEDRCIQVLEHYNFLTNVTVEPLVLFFDVVVWVSSVSKVGLSSSANAPVPLSTYFGSGEGLEL